MNSPDIKGVVFNIQRFSLHDGPGIRTIVFLKGCPLRCRWCANPESIKPEPELGFTRAKCDKCLKCVKACNRQAISIGGDGLPEVDRGQCTNCGECVAVCLAKALILYGEEMTPAEALAEVARDRIFYDGSNGGVTASGGEPLLQAGFVKALFELSHQSGIRTALETSGFAPKEVFASVLAVTDYVLFDLKHIDSNRHFDLTGRKNRVILENARQAIAKGVELLFRSPLVPGMNDTPENIEATARVLRELQGEKAAIELIPYHRLGTAKYRALDRRYSLEDLRPHEAAKLSEVQEAYRCLGVSCLISS